MDISLGLENTHVIVTGGAGMIGSKVVEAFIAADARVSSLDIKHPLTYDNEPNLRRYYVDISDEASVQVAWGAAVAAFGPVSCCVALASLDLSVLKHGGVVDMDHSQFMRTMGINVGGTFLTARQWLRGLKEQPPKAKSDEKDLRNVSLIVVGSESGWFGERQQADYSAGKSAVQVGLLKSLAGEAPRIWEGARVNAIAPGPVDTPTFKKECKENPDQYYENAQATVPLRKPVPMDQVAKGILFLASENFSANVHGQVLDVASGKQGKLSWTKEDCS